MSSDKSDKTLRQLQATLPWGAHEYSPAFQADKSPFRDPKHAYVHFGKALGKFAAVIDTFDHKGELSDADRAEYGKALADFVIVATRAATVFPGKAIDLAGAVEYRLREKFPGPPVDTSPTKR